MSLTAEQKARYERNLQVAGFTPANMESLLRAHVTVVGAGGLGSAVLSYLVAAGVGCVTIIEDDTVSVGNLQRQILYTTSQIALPKAECAAMRLSQLNPLCDIRTFPHRLTAGNAGEALAGSDVVVDCTDNFATRYIIDDFCHGGGIPMIYGTAQDMEGQVSVFNYGRAGAYRELYPEAPQQKPVVGVLGPVAGVTGSLQAMETVKVICSLGDTLDGRLLTFDAMSMAFTIFELK